MHAEQFSTNANQRHLLEKGVAERHNAAALTARSNWLAASTLVMRTQVKMRS